MFKVKIACAADVIKEIFEKDHRVCSFPLDILIKLYNFDWYNTALKQLHLLDQKYGTLYLIAAKMQLQ